MENTTRDTNHRTGLPALRVTATTTETDETRLKDELLAVLLHDLRSPLGAVGVLSELITNVANQGNSPDPRQLKLLQESVAKAQRVLEDAVEIQSIIRGSSTFTPYIVDLGLLVSTCIDKTAHAPHFSNIKFESNIPRDATHVSVDVEKLETVLLCLFEQIALQHPNARSIALSTTQSENHIILHLEIPLKQVTQPDPPNGSFMDGHHTLRGRLGTRRIGESRYNYEICTKVLTLMGGQLIESDKEHPGINIHLPIGAN